MKTVTSCRAVGGDKKAKAFSEHNKYYLFSVLYAYQENTSNKVT